MSSEKIQLPPKEYAEHLRKAGRVPCKGCNGFHGSESVHVHCLERKIASLQDEMKPLLAERAKRDELIRSYKRIPMTPGGHYESIIKGTKGRL